jgi:hypothetical protein
MTADHGNGSQRQTAWLTVLSVGLIAGTLDISDAIIYSHIRGVTAERVCQLHRQRADRHESVCDGRRVGGAWRHPSLLHRAQLVRDFLRREPPADDSYPPSDSERAGLRCCGLSVHEPDRTAAFGRASTERTNVAGFQSQCCAGCDVVHRADDLSAGKQVGTTQPEQNPLR